ncbi:MAG: biotin synthase BioB [Planctomycetota bacterium]|nr:biotin synthase BioB [Planctomycetota bacterium]
MTVATTALSREALQAVYDQPLLELVFQAAQVHRAHHDPRAVQCASLLSIKTGACPEDCAYCPQSAHHNTELEREPFIESEAILAAAQNAKAGGADRFCMGAAWREARNGKEFDAFLETVTKVKGLGLETCATLGMLDEDQARRLEAAGLDYYNHNLDTSPEHYDKIITTRTYADRLRTLQAVRDSGMKVCCGGILGMGEEVSDRVGLIHALATLEPQPESVPINALVAVEGTPLEDTPPLPWDDLVRAVATARIAMPKAYVRLSAGRTNLTEEAQALCFLAGANSVFLGDKLLTTPNRGRDDDHVLFEKLGLTPLEGGTHVDG